MVITSRVKFIYAVIFFIAPLFLSAQTLVIEMDKDTISLEETISITYKVNESCNASELKFDDFLVVSGPNVSRSISIVNGKKTAESSYSVLLTPINQGTFTLPTSLCGVTVEKPVIVVVIANYESKETVDQRIKASRKIKKI